MKRLLLVLFLALLLALLLAACAPDPRNQADANRTEALTVQDAADREQARKQAAALGDLELQQAQAVSGEVIAARARLIRWASYAGSVALAALILAAAAGLSWGAVGTGKAAARLVTVRANLIPLDEQTRQYPLFLAYQGKGRYTLTNANTGSVTLLDTRRDPDRQLITAAGAVLLAGVVAREARRSTDPAGVAIVKPAIIGGGSDENL